ncbi:MAG: Integral membrane protein TerC, partial [uncultured Thermoleophilia bacterium]
ELEHADLDRAGRGHPRPARRRRDRHARPPRALAALGGRVERHLDRGRRPVRGRRLAGPGRRRRGGVPGRLPGREDALARQPGRLRHGLRGAAGPRPAPGQAPVPGDRRRGRAARRGDRGRGGAARGVRLAALRLRRLPDLDRVADGPRRRPRRPRPVARRRPRPPRPARDGPARRRAAADPGERSAGVDAARPGARPDRDVRRGVRRRLDPGHLRHHARHVDRLRGERVLPARHAGAVRGPLGPPGPVRVPAAEPGRRPRRHRDQDAGRRARPRPAVRVPARHHRAARRGRDRLAAARTRSRHGRRRGPDPGAGGPGPRAGIGSV